MKYNLISMDFDGTLLTSNKKVTTTTRNTLIEYKKNKHIIVGITARNLSSVKGVCDIDLFDYLILNNGSHIYDVKNEKGINVSNIDRNVAIEITENTKNIATQIDYCSLNKYYINTKEKLEPKNYLVKIESIDEVTETIARMNIFLHSTEEINKYREYIESNFNTVNVISMLDTDNVNSRKWLTINPKEVSKYSTLERLCTQLNISIKNVIFFGDGTNDLSIMNKVGLGVAMGNALQEVKDQAKAITLSNDEDGVAVFLNRLLKEDDIII